MSDEYAEWEAAQEADEYAAWEAREAAEAKKRSARPAHMDIGQAKLPFDVDATIQERFNNPSAQRRTPLPGDQPKAYAEGDPQARNIAMDASLASAARAETPDEKATRNLNGWMAGSQKVPFFPQVRGAVAAGLAGIQGQPMGPAYNAEVANARQQIGEAASRAPAAALVGEAASAFALPGGVAAKTAGGRIVGNTAVGALYGAAAADRPGATADDYLAGAAFGVPFGLGGSLAGELGLSKVFRGAEKRQDQAFMRELTRANGGEGQMAMLAKNKEGILKDYENIVATRRDPEIRKAVGMKNGEGIPVMDKRLAPLRDAQDARYAKIDEAVAHPFVQNQMTPRRLMEELDKQQGIIAKTVEPGIAPFANARLDYLKQQIEEFWIPKVWGGDANAVIPSREFRRWLTGVQGQAANTPGSLNWTRPYASLEVASRASKNIFNNYLDSANLPKLADEIRQDNAKITSLLHIRSAMEAKAKKEALEQVGLGQVMADQGRKMELGAAAAATMAGHPEAGAAILARPYVEGAVRRTAGWTDREIVEPMQRAAEAGSSPAQLARFAVERGLPQGTADMLASRVAAQATGARQSSPQPQVATAQSPMSPLQRSFLGQEAPPNVGPPDANIQGDLRRMLPLASRLGSGAYGRIGQ